MRRILVNDGNAGLISNGKQEECIEIDSQWLDWQKVSKRLNSIPRINHEKNMQHRC